MSIEILKFRECKKNTLQGFVTVRMTSVGLEIRDICVHRRDDQRWLSMPARSYRDADGKNQYAYILDWYDETRKEQFQRAVLGMLDGGGYGKKSN